VCGRHLPPLVLLYKRPFWVQVNWAEGAGWPHSVQVRVTYGGYQYHHHLDHISPQWKKQEAAVGRNAHRLPNDGL
jgi:hypothetical protein